MARPLTRRPYAWAATVVLLAVSVLHLATASGGDPLGDATALISAVLGVAGLLTVFRFVTAHCFESRLAMTFVGAATVVALLLTHTLGAPGTSAVAWSGRDLLLLAFAAALALSWPATAPAKERPAER